MIPVRRNIDTDDLILWLDPSSPLSYIKSEAANSIAGRGKNLFAGTEAFTNTFNLNLSKAAWTQDSVTPYGRRRLEPILDGMILDPDGGNQTRLLRETAETGEHFFRQDMPIEGINLGPSERITYSMYVREDLTSAARQIRISHTNTAPSTGGLVYDFATSTLTPLNPSGIEDYGVIPASGGWVRIWYTIKFISPGSQLNAGTFIYLLDGSGNDNYAGDGTSGVYAYGPQWEEGVLSNYVKVEDGGEFAGGFQNRKIGRLSLVTNPLPYTTSFEGTNFRFDGFNSGFASGAGTRLPFRSTGTSNQSLKNHTAFAWVKVDTSTTPDGSPEIYTVFGRIGGKSNNGVFGVGPGGTTIRYKVRARYEKPDLSTVAIPNTFESTSFPTIADTWHLIAADYDYLASTVNFYMDGQLVSSDVYTPNPGYTNIGVDGSGSGIQFGSFTSGATALGQFRGGINIAGFYDKALDAGEHAALYDATKYRFHN